MWQISGRSRAKNEELLSITSDNVWPSVAHCCQINFSPCFKTCDSCRGYLFFRRIGVFCHFDTIVSILCRYTFSMVNLAVIFDVKMLLNVTEFLPTSFWITATDGLHSSTTNRKHPSLRHNSCHVEPLFIRL